MKLRNRHYSTMLTHAIREATLPPAKPEVPAWMLDALDTIMWVDEPAPGLVRLSHVKGRSFEPIVSEMPGGWS